MEIPNLRMTVVNSWKLKARIESKSRGGEKVTAFYNPNSNKVMKRRGLKP